MRLNSGESRLQLIFDVWRVAVSSTNATADLFRVGIKELTAAASMHAILVLPRVTHSMYSRHELYEYTVAVALSGLAGCAISIISASVVMEAARRRNGGLIDDGASCFDEQVRVCVAFGCSQFGGRKLVMSGAFLKYASKANTMCLLLNWRTRW